MIASTEILETVQADVLAMLLATPALANAAIIDDADGDIESRVTKALSTTVKNRADKYGLAIIVMAPEVSSAEKNLPGPHITVRVDIQILEHVQTNRGSQGTGLRSSRAAMLVLNALHLYQFGGHALYADSKPIVPLPAVAGMVSHAVTLYIRSTGIAPMSKPLGIQANMSSGEVTLSCGSGGSSIRYTKDGSYPAPSKILYTAPISGLAVGTVIRAAGYVFGMAPGDVLEFTITD